MARTLFLIWEDWDGTRVEEFANVEEAENRCTQVQALCDLNENGTIIHALIQGRRITMQVVETAKKVKIA